mmetsp:Transcript_20425/g.31250  ORF Transcript_20425/g.31250 Transcript_20425/m.31250 type:complete len:315 (+) Transcript_20425:477-1421(+)
MGLVTNQQITCVLMLIQSPYMRSNTFITCNQNLEHFRLDKQINVLLHSLTILIRQRQSFDSARPKPLDKFVIPIFHQTARTNYNDTLCRWFLIGHDTRLQECVYKHDTLQCLTKTHIISQNTACTGEVALRHDAFVQETDSLALMWSQPFGEDWRNIYALFGVGRSRGWLDDLDFFFDTIFITLHLYLLHRRQPFRLATLMWTNPNTQRLKRLFIFLRIRLLIAIRITTITITRIALRQSIRQTLPRPRHQLRHSIHPPPLTKAASLQSTICCFIVRSTLGHWPLEWLVEGGFRYGKAHRHGSALYDDFSSTGE